MSHNSLMSNSSSEWAYAVAILAAALCLRVWHNVMPLHVSMQCLLYADMTQLPLPT